MNKQQREDLDTVLYWALLGFDAKSFDTEDGADLERLNEFPLIQSARRLYDASIRETVTAEVTALVKSEERKLAKAGKCFADRAGLIESLIEEQIQTYTPFTEYALSF